MLLQLGRDPGVIFNSHIFVFCFLPAVVLGIYVLITYRYPAARLCLFLLLASLVFYAYWNPHHLPLLIASIGANYLFGSYLARHRRRVVLGLALVLNLGTLAYFKYSGFIASWFALHDTFQVPELPLAISFFTFQQIAFVVDCYMGNTREQSLIRYALFVSFFPQLIAGPILRHREIRDQLSAIRLRRDDITAGAVTFILGLAKKVIIADQLSHYTTYFFNATPHDFVTAWLAGLSFSFEIYFDFSAYSDMAIGLARIFGLRFPDNFNSPYRSTSVIEFWGRWHIPLSQFLRDYLYIPLGGNRKGWRFCSGVNTRSRL